MSLEEQNRFRPGEDESATNHPWLELSLAQQAIWLDAKLNPQAPIQLGGWARIEGDIDEASASQALRLVMARHDALKLRVDDERPRQWLSGSAVLPFSVSSMHATESVQSAFEAYMDELFASPLPLGDRPLFRLELIKVHSCLCFLVWRFHHLIADSVSTTLTMSYWTEAYLAIVSEEVPHLSSRSSYLDVISSDQAYLASKEHRDDAAYWLKRFDPLPEPLIPGIQASEGHRREGFYSDWSLSHSVWSQIGVLASKLQVSPSRIFFAAFTVTVAARFQRQDVVCGVALHRRDSSSMSALGMFSGVLPLRCYVDRRSPMDHLIQQFSRQMDQDMRHQRMPADLLARQLGLFRLGRKHLFEVVMSFLPAERIQNESLSPDLPVTSGVVALKEASPVSLHITEILSGEAQIRIAVNPEIVRGEEATMLLGDLKSVVERVLRNPSIIPENLFSFNHAEHAIVEDKHSSGDDYEEWTV